MVRDDETKVGMTGLYWYFMDSACRGAQTEELTVLCLFEVAAKTRGSKSRREPEQHRRFPIDDHVRLLKGVKEQTNTMDSAWEFGSAL